jgi:murein DD-endopeptidase MepM/ murein hydrolase activator NlpD
MFSFLSEFTRNVDAPSTIIVMDAEGYEQPRHYHIVPRHVLFFGLVAAGFMAVVLLCVIIFTPVRELIPGYGTAEMRQNARLNELRVIALQDSLEAQGGYALQLRNLMLGQIDTSSIATMAAQLPGTPETEAQDPGEVEQSSNWADHRQPAISLERMEAGREIPFRLASISGRTLPSVLFPALPPVEGFITRTFEARTGHYAVDIAVQEGTIIRSIGDGYVIFSDWTHEGGYAIAVQHSDGYVSVYKHNERLLKRIGDRVRTRDEIAISGNSGEISSGPHLHFELWHDGLAQDPRNYFVGN